MVELPPDRLSRHTRVLIGVALFAIAAASAMGFWLGATPDTIFGAVPAGLFALAAGLVLPRWWLLGLTAASGAIPWVVIENGTTKHHAAGHDFTLLLFLIVGQLGTVGVPVLLGVGAARTRRRPRRRGADATHVLMARVWAHLFDLEILYVPAGIAFGSDNGAFVAFLLGLLYFGWFQGRRGFTLGKWLVGLRVIGPDGEVPGTRRALKRYVTLIFEWTGIFGLFFARRSPTRQRLGDRWAKTEVRAVEGVG